MKLCTTCSREWEVLDGVCPADGTLLVSSQRISAASGRSVQVATGYELSEEELPPGTPVGEYEIERLLGFGGMGVVYGARHPLIGKRAAVKVLSAKYSADHVAVTRFVQEAQAVNQIGHANIVDVFAFGRLPDGRSYFIMEWLQGETLGERLGRSPLSAAEAIPIIVTLTRALEAAHTSGVVHRDLKPDNIFLVSEDGGVRVKLLDFGIAKLSSPKSFANRTATGIAVGTPLYMSPEQARGSDLDARTDLYSLGIVAYEMVCGRTPFEDEASAVETLGAHIAKPPRPPSELVPDLPESFEGVVLDLLAKDPAQRPSLSDVRWRLTRLATNPSISTDLAEHAASSGASNSFSRPSSGTLQIRRSARRWLALAAAVLATAVIYLVTSRLSREVSDEPPPPAIPARSAAAASLPTPPPVSVTPPASAPRGSVEITVDPATATLLIDGAPVRLDRGVARLELAPGHHEATVTALRRRTLRQTFEVVVSQNTMVRVSLKPTAPTKRTTNSDDVVNPFEKKPRKR